MAKLPAFTSVLAVRSPMFSRIARVSVSRWPASSRAQLASATTGCTITAGASAFHVEGNYGPVNGQAPVRHVPSRKNRAEAKLSLTEKG